MRRKPAGFALAFVFGTASYVLSTMVGPAAAVPPVGACTSISASGPTVRQIPWTQETLAPQRAWPFSRGAGVTVAVIDSGVDSDHPQLARNGKVLHGYDFLRDRPDADFDCVSHGTAVASIIAADPSPDVGFAGVAPGARLLPVRVSDIEAGSDTGTSVEPSVFANAIRYAADHGAGVINLSVVLNADVPAVRDAVVYAESKDAVIVAAVGNQHKDNGADPIPYPAAYPGVIGVGAITESGTRSNESQVGPYVDLVAPGAGVLADTRVRGQAFWDGTSFAAPFVSGTAALVRAAFPKLHAPDIIDRLLATADAAPGGASGPEYGRGVVDPYRAVTEVLALGTPASRQLPVHTPMPDLAAAHRAAIRHQRAQHADRAVIGAAGVAGVGALILMLVTKGRRRRWRPGS